MGCCWLAEYWLMSFIFLSLHILKEARGDSFLTNPCKRLNTSYVHWLLQIIRLNTLVFVTSRALLFFMNKEDGELINSQIYGTTDKTTLYIFSISKHFWQSWTKGVTIRKRGSQISAMSSLKSSLWGLSHWHGSVPVSVPEPKFEPDGVFRPEKKKVWKGRLRRACSG